MTSDKKIENVKFYCKKPHPYHQSYGVKYEAVVRDALKKATPVNIKFIENGGQVIETKNQFSSIKILDAREGSSFYFYIGIETGKGLAFIQIQAAEITDIFSTGTMLNGKLIGNFEFVQSGSHTRFQAVGDQKAGYCRFWLDAYDEYDIFTKEETAGMQMMLEGGKEDSVLCSIMIEARKGDYYKAMFGNGS
jgi:hypothetical protein